MKMKRLPGIRRDSVNVNSNQFGCPVREPRPGFFPHFAPGRIPNLNVIRLDVSTRKEPPL